MEKCRSNRHIFHVINTFGPRVAGPGAYGMAGMILYYVLRGFSILIFIRVIFSWIPMSPRSPLAPLAVQVYNLTEWALAPIRSVLSRVTGNIGLDFSPLVLILLVEGLTSWFL